MSAEDASPRRVARPDWLLLVLAVVVAHGFFARILLYPSAFDATNYLAIADDIERYGLFRQFPGSELRTYGYPLFLAVFSGLARWTGTPVGPWLFEAQLALYLGAVLFLRAGLVRFAPAVTRLVFAALALNAIALAYTAESLTESLTLTLILIVAGAWLRLLAAPAPSQRTLLIGTLAAAFAMMVRPANLFVLAAWLAAVVAVAVSGRWSARSAVLAALAILVGVAVPFAPQIANNVRYYGQATPLPTTDLGRSQQIWGIAILKYGTALPPVPQPSVFYTNPFAQGRPVDEAQPLRWYREHPGAGAATLAVHAFNLLDQDLLFTYSRDLDPWYRIPLGIVTHGLIALALVGFFRLLRRAAHDRNARLAAIAIAAFVGLHVVVHAPTAVEMRFGLPLLVVAFPMGTWVAADIAGAGWRSRLLLAIFVASWIAASLAASTWVRDQAPSIRAWQAAHR